MVKHSVTAVTAGLAFLLMASSAQAQGKYNKGGSRAPDGVWLAGGLNVSAGGGPDGAGVRLEVGVPLKVVGPGQFSLAFPFSTYHDPYHHGPDDFRDNVASVGAEVQYEYVFPIKMKPRLGLSPLFGLGLGGIWRGGHHVRNDDGAFLMTWRLGAVLRLGFENGLILAMEPFAVTLNAAFDYRPYHDFFANYEWYFLAGYRFD